MPAVAKRASAEDIWLWLGIPPGFTLIAIPGSHLEPCPAHGHGVGSVAGELYTVGIDDGWILRRIHAIGAKIPRSQEKTNARHFRGLQQPFRTVCVRVTHEILAGTPTVADNPAGISLHTNEVVERRIHEVEMSAVFRVSIEQDNVCSRRCSQRGDYV